MFIAHVNVYVYTNIYRYKCIRVCMLGKSTIHEKIAQRM